MEIFTGKYTIKQIFKEHWEEYLERYPDIPDYIRKEVRKVLHCRDPEKGGYYKYTCPSHPEESVVIPFSCKSRFCNVCGVYQTNLWINNATTDFPKTSYWHITFTVPDYLWYFFRHEPNKPLLDLLFKASRETALGWFKARNLIPGVTSILHTFGKKLNYNTHIHMLITAAGLGNDQKQRLFWQEIDYLPENMLKKRWRAILLKMLQAYLDSSFNSSFKRILFKINWYVHLSAKITTPEVTCRYIGRYTKRPVIAESRIVDYDKTFVTFFYQDTSEGYKKTAYAKLTWEEFISQLIQHIPQPQFKMIRYYGLLSNSVRKKYQKIVFKLLNQTKRISQWLQWRIRQLKYRKIDPLICKICGQEMVLKELAFYSSFSESLKIKTF